MTTNHNALLKRLIVEATVRGGLTLEEADELARNFITGLPAACEQAAVACLDKRIENGWLTLVPGAKEQIAEGFADAVADLVEWVARGGYLR